MTRYRGLPLITAVNLVLAGLLAASPAASAPPSAPRGVTGEPDPAVVIVMSSISAPPVMYRGYSSVGTFQVGGPDVGTPVAIQAKVEGTWRVVGRGSVQRGATAVLFRAPRGTTALRPRLVAFRGVFGPVTRVQVRTARTWPEAELWPGRWTGTSSQHLQPVSFQVATDGKVLEDGRFAVRLRCPDPAGTAPPTHRFVLVQVPRVRITPAGSFGRRVPDSGPTALVWGQDQGTSYWEVGVAVTAGSCAGRASYVLRQVVDRRQASGQQTSVSRRAGSSSTLSGPTS